MKRVNFWKTLFLSALTVAAFTGCSNDDSDEGGVMPSITVNGQSSTTLAIGLEGGKTEAVEIVSSGAWTLKVEGENGAAVSECVPTPASGNGGTTSVTFDLSKATAARSYKVTVTTSGTIPGVGITADVSATIKIEQTDSYVPTTDALYSENCGTTVEKDGSYWPYVDKFTGWTRGGTLDQSGVTYSGSSASVRNSGKDYDPTDDEKAEVSGYPYAYMNSTANFDINGINVGTNTNFTFTFTALSTVSTLSESPYTPTFGDVTASTLKFSASTDGGTTWMPVEITTKKLGTGSWYLCTAMFKLPAGVSTDKISVRFSNYTGGASLRLDDFKLYEGGDGAELAPEVPTSGTISQITETGATYTIENATVVGTYKQGFVMQDATGAILVYMGSDSETPIPAEGSKVTVSGETSMYGGALQLKNVTVTTTGTGSMPTLTPTEVTADNIAGMMTAPKATYVKMTGTLSAGNYINVKFLFESDYTGSISSPNDDLNVSSFDGKVVDVEGWFVNNGSTNNKGSYFTVVARKVTENASVASGSFTKQPETFAAADPQAQTLTYEANAAAGNVTFEITGADAGQFSVTPKTGSVEVSAKGDNTSDAIYTATLVMKAADGTVLDQVALSQLMAGVKSYVPVTTAPADWSGTYVIGYPKDNTVNILNTKYVPDSNKTTFTNKTLESPVFDGTNIAYGEYETIEIAKIPGTDFYSMKYGSEYVGWESSTANNCQFTTATPTADTPSYQWAIELTEDKTVSMICQLKDGDNYRFFNYNASSPRFAIYKNSSQMKVTFYKLQ